jgi:hypothetical protein
LAHLVKAVQRQDRDPWRNTTLVKAVESYVSARLGRVA